MKTNLLKLPALPTWFAGTVRFLLGLGLCVVSFQARAVLPEPDNVVFGTIALDGRPITAADYDVVVEVRRTADGPAVASYQMGANPRLGNYYSVRIPLESLTPRLETNAAVTGDVFYLVVGDVNGQRETRSITVGTRGAFHRLDIGTAVPDSDNDGLPDVWELAYIGNLNQNPSGDADGDGLSNQDEYSAGTNPNNRDDLFKLHTSRVAANQFVSFFARRAEGPGYDGYDRIYTLEYRTNVVAGSWLTVPGRANILGDNATNTYLTIESSPAAFYRGRVRLQPR